MAHVRRACIDIGSNTTRLLVADCAAGRLTEVHQERAFTRIGRAVRLDGALAPGKLDEVSRVVSEQLASARRLGAAEVRCVATASLRGAVNGDELVARIRAACGGLAVEVLSGEDEARLAFAGAAATREPPPRGPLAVVDVGGGSYEVAVGTAPDRVIWWTSVPLGTEELTSGCVRSDPPSSRDLDDARTRAAAALAGIRPPATALAVAVGGSATSLRRLVGPTLDEPAISRALATLTSHPAAQVAARFELEPNRVELLTAGLVILEATAALLEVPLEIGRGGLREGILLSQLW